MNVPVHYQLKPVHSQLLKEVNIVNLLGPQHRMMYNSNLEPTVVGTRGVHQPIQSIG